MAVKNVYMPCAHEKLFFGIFVSNFPLQPNHDIHRKSTNHDNSQCNLPAMLHFPRLSHDTLQEALYLARYAYWLKCGGFLLLACYIPNVA